MTAYFVFIREETTDANELATYRSMVGPTFVGRSIDRLAAYGEHAVFEGAPIEGVVILEFPTMAEATAWYESPAYQEAAAHRWRGATYRAIAVEGVA